MKTGIILFLSCFQLIWRFLKDVSLQDRSRVVPRSDSACVFTERFLRSENAGFTKSRRVIGEHVSHPLVGWRSSDQEGWGLRSNLIGRGIFEYFHVGSKGNIYSKIATPRIHIYSPLSKRRYYRGFLRLGSNHRLSSARRRDVDIGLWGVSILCASTNQLLAV